MEIIAIILLIIVLLGFRVVQQYEKALVLRFGKYIGTKNPGLRWIIPFVDRLWKVDQRIVTLSVPPQSIITKDNVTIAVSAVCYFHVSDSNKAVLNVTNYYDAVNQISQTTLRNIVGTFQLDEILSSRNSVSAQIKEIVDQHTAEWGINVTLIELKDIELPQSMQRAMAKQAEAEREKRAKIITAEAEQMSAAVLGEAADIMAAHPIALQLRNLQVLGEIAIEKNSTIIFPSQFLSTIDEVKRYMAMEHGTPLTPVHSQTKKAE